MNYSSSYSLCDSKQKPLDHKLVELFDKNDGFFIELGAHDGLTQSNTALLEFKYGWKGVLIEPSPEAYSKCKQNRPKSICFNNACVSSTYIGSTVKGDFSGILMASVDSARLQKESTIEVNARTLESILNEVNPVKIDLLSLDTEGYELNILDGLNLSKWRPHYMLIEVYTTELEKITEFLEQNKYKLSCNYSNYNKVDCPLWDGTHNDYLFIDITV